METIKKSYLPIKNKENYFLKIEIYYSKEEKWIFQDERGYFVSVTPIEKINHGSYSTERMEAFKGYKMLLKEIGRKSNKALQEALAKSESVIEMLIDRVCKENDYKL